MVNSSYGVDIWKKKKKLTEQENVTRRSGRFARPKIERLKKQEMGNQKPLTLKQRSRLISASVKIVVDGKLLRSFAQYERHKQTLNEKKNKRNRH